MAAPRDHGWWPYLGPYGLFLLLVEIGARVPEGFEGSFRVLRVVLPGLWLLYFVWQGRLPELRNYRPGLPGLAQDVAFGAAIAALWMGPYLLFPSLSRPGPAEGFDAGVFGPGREAFAYALRLVGFAAAVLVVAAVSVLLAFR